MRNGFCGAIHEGSFTHEAWLAEFVCSAGVAWAHAICTIKLATRAAAIKTRTNPSLCGKTQDSYIDVAQCQGWTACVSPSAWTDSWASAVLATKTSTRSAATKHGNAKPAIHVDHQ